MRSRFDPAFDLRRRPAAQSGELLQRAVFDGFDFGLQFNYFDGIGAVLKNKYRGFFIAKKDHPHRRSWRIGKAVVETDAHGLFNDLVSLAQGSSTQSIESFLRKIDDARAMPQPSAFTVDVKQQIYPLNNGSVAMIGTYHPGVVAIMRAMRARFLPRLKAWKLADTTPAALKNNLITELHLRDEQVVVMVGEYEIEAFSQGAGSDIPIRVPDSMGFEAGQSNGVEDVDETDNEIYLAVTSPLQNTAFDEAEFEAKLSNYSLYDFQQTGVRHLATRSSALLADDMGLGKSRQAVVAADILRGDGKVLIVCPASLIINWTREIQMVVPQAAVAVQAFDPAAQWIVTNYEQLEHLVPHAGAFQVMVIDEAHLLKEPSTLRTRIAFDIAAKIPRRFILTGTPILNRECEMHTLLRLSGHPVGAIPLKEFETQFAGSPQFRNDLNQRMREWMLRRKKDVVLKTLKGKQHQVVYVNPETTKMTVYRDVLKDKTLRSLEKISKLRQLLEAIKIDAIVDMIAQMQPDDKVLVFCEFIATVDEFKTRLEGLGVGTVTLVGKNTLRQRQAAVDAFQNDTEVRAFVGTTAAAGVGWNLTAANLVVLGSLPWTPGLKEQAEDRAYRNGQQRMVLVKIPLVENTIDADLWDMLRNKNAIATDVLNPEESAQMQMQWFAQDHLPEEQAHEDSVSV